MFRPYHILFISFFFICASALSAASQVEVVIRGIGGTLFQNVRTALELPYGLVEDGRVNTFWLERFRKDIPETVRRALEPYGYYNAEVESSIEKLGEDSYRLVVTVQPGKPVRITAVNVAIKGPGRDEQALRKVAAGFPLRPGDVLYQPRYQEAKASLRSRAVELGYLDADFATRVIAVDPAAYSARIDLVMETGPQYRFNGVRFEGAPRYPDQYLRRFVTFEPGDVFSYAGLGETQLNLINSERFTEVVPVPQRDETVDHRVPVLIRLEPAPTKRVRPGIGYATDIGPRLTLEYRDLNVRDKGHEFRSELNLSNRLQNVGAGYTIPGKSIDTMTGLQTNLRREDVKTYTTTNASTEVNRTLSLGRGRLGAAYVRLEREKSTVADAPLDSRILLPGARISEQRYDSLVRPTEGHHYTIDLRGTHEAFGSNSQFLQLVAEGSVLIPLPWRLSVYSRVKAGVTIQDAPPETLPVSYRFFAGGDRSVRGYAYQSLGPTDASGRVVGGRDILVGSVELARTLSADWGAAVFYDAGNAFNYFNDYRLFQGAGIGARYYTVLGTVRLDLARQINVDDPSYRFHLTVGFAF